MITSEENVRAFIDAWKLMTGRFAGSDFQCADGVASMFANIGLPFMNISFQDRPVGDELELRAMLRTMKRRACACRHSSMIGPCTEWLPRGWQTITGEEGFNFGFNLTGMATEALSPLKRQLPELKYRRVLNDATARDLATVNAQAYDMPMEVWEGICNMQLWHEDTYGFVAYHGIDAVSAAAVFPIDGAMYVQWVATSPTEQHKGYAESVMRKAIEVAQAENGPHRIILHATDMGQTLYQSMGFIAGCQIPLLSAD